MDILDLRRLRRIAASRWVLAKRAYHTAKNVVVELNNGATTTLPDALWEARDRADKAYVDMLLWGGRVEALDLVMLAEIEGVENPVTDYVSARNFVRDVEKDVEDADHR